MKSRMIHTAGRFLATAGKDIAFGNSARASILKGCDLIADAVQITLGPRGRNVIIDQPYGGPKITKDGVTVAKSIEFSDPHLNLGASLIKSCANATNEAVGDGTTASTILSRSIFHEGCKAVAAGMNPMDLRRGIIQGVSNVMTNLKSCAKSVTTDQETTQVATISANGDTEMGNMISTAIKKVGRSGVITVEDGTTHHDELEVVDGMKFDRGFISRYFVTDLKTQKCEFQNPYLLVCDRKISNYQSILPLLDKFVKKNPNQPLVIIAEDIEGDALATLIVNRLHGAQFAAVKAPGFGDNRKAMLHDIAVCSGAHLLSDEIGLKLEDADIEHLGRAKKVIISKDDTIIFDGAGDKKPIQDQIEAIELGIKQTSSNYEKDKLKERLARFTGGIAVIKVGGGSEVEVSERKDRMIDAMHATRAAIEEGVVPGGGVALLYASQTLPSLKCSNFDQEIGVKILQKAIETPVRAIAANAGHDGGVIAGKLLDKAAGKVTCTYGFDANTGKFCDMFEVGIIDPFKVVRTYLSDSSSIGGMLITAEATVTDVQDKTDKNCPPNPGMHMPPEMM